MSSHVTAKLEQKLKYIEEERNEMKNDFYVKINNFAEQIENLKERLSCNIYILLIYNFLEYEKVESDNEKEEEDEG